jgi:TRAP-type C4-dicarboxylate transport system permease small subunit
MTKLAKICDRLLGAALMGLMLTLVYCVTWQVVSRYVFSQPGSWTEELARFALIWIGLLGTAYAYRTRAHMAIDQLVNKLGERWGVRIELLAVLAVAVFAAAVMIYGGGALVMLTLELDQLSAALGVRMGIVYLAIPLSGALLVFYALVDAISLVDSWRQAPRAGA